VVIVVVVVMPVVVMMTLTYSHHDLRLRRIRCCEAENEGQCEQNLLHPPSMSVCPLLCRATLTCRTLYTEYVYILFKYSTLQHETAHFSLEWVIPYEQTPVVPVTTCELFAHFITTCGLNL